MARAASVDKGAELGLPNFISFMIYRWEFSVLNSTKTTFSLANSVHFVLLTFLSLISCDLFFVLCINYLIESFPISQIKIKISRH